MEQESANTADPQSQLSKGSGHWIENVGETSMCANCGSPRESAFCAHCGQKHLTERLRFGEMMREMVSRLTDFDRGLLHTFLDLMIRPGQVAKDYVTGKQKPYVNPLTYFFIGTACQMISLFLCESILVRMLKERFTTGLPPQARTQLDTAFEGDAAQGMAEVYISSVQQGYAYAALFCFCLPFAFLLYLLQRIAGDRFRFSETCIFALYCFGQMLVITAVTTPIAIRIGFPVQMATALGTYFVFPLHAHTGFFRSTWLARILTATTTLISSMLFFGSILVIFMGYLIATVAVSAAAQGGVAP